MAFHRTNVASLEQRAYQYSDMGAVLSEVLEPGYFPAQWLGLNDILLVLARDGFAFVRVIGLDELQRPIFEYGRAQAGPPAASVAHTYRPRKAA